MSTFQPDNHFIQNPRKSTTSAQGQLGSSRNWARPIQKRSWGLELVALWEVLVQVVTSLLLMFDFVEIADVDSGHILSLTRIASIGLLSRSEPPFFFKNATVTPQIPTLRINDDLCHSCCQPLFFIYAREVSLIEYLSSTLPSELI